MRVFIKRGNLRTEEEKRQHAMSQMQLPESGRVHGSVPELPDGPDAGAAKTGRFERKKVAGQKGRGEKVAG